jgi:DNA-binding CsgD family transcriptional regulator
MPGHSLLEAGTAVLAAAQQILTLTAHGSFLALDQLDGDGRQAYLQVTAMAIPSDLNSFASAVVVLSEPPNLHGLTTRELQILGFLIEGWPNRAIASALIIAQRTVASHVEHILAKLDAPTRALAAVRAQRSGLYLPCRTAQHRDSGRFGLVQSA